jgi:hypothetical protein
MSDYLGSVFTLKWEENPTATPLIQHSSLVASGSLEAAIVSLANSHTENWVEGVSEVFYGSRNGKYHDTLVDEMGQAPITLNITMVDNIGGDDVYPNRVSAYAGTIIPVEVAFGETSTQCIVSQGGVPLFTITDAGPQFTGSYTLTPDAVDGLTATLVATFS